MARRALQRAWHCVGPVCNAEERALSQFLSLANSGRAELLDIGRLLSQFSGLQRRAGRSGKDSVDLARDQHDDLANAAAGVLVSLDLDRSPGLVDQGKLVNAVGGGFPEPMRPSSLQYV
jgi:hypothetical protein